MNPGKGTVLQRHTGRLRDGDATISIQTDFISNGLPLSKRSGYYKKQTFSIENRWNAFGASFGNALTPEVLRKWADELEKIEKKVYRKKR